MYLDALSFLEDERDDWRAFEALDELTDEQLSDPRSTAHGWSGRDLMAHLVAWQEHALTVARELAVEPTSRTKVQGDRDWDARGDQINDEIMRVWRALPIAEVRDRFRTVAGELRGYLTVVPETRWVKNAEYLKFFLSETLEHYVDHRDDLAAVLASAG